MMMMMWGFMSSDVMLKSWVSMTARADVTAHGNWRGLMLVTGRSLPRLSLSGTTFLLTSDTAVLSQFKTSLKTFLFTPAYSELLRPSQSHRQWMLYLIFFFFAADIFTGWLLIIGGMGGGVKWRETVTGGERGKWGVARERKRVCVCVCAYMCMCVDARENEW